MKRLMLIAAMLPGGALAQAVTPGQWDIAITTDSFSMPNMPPEAAKSMQGKTMHVKHCITPAEAARGPQDLLKASKECSFTKYSVVGGRMHAEMVCKHPGGTMTSVSDGSYTPTGFRSTGRTVMTGDAPMTMSATTVGTRTGPCK